MAFDDARNKIARITEAAEAKKAAEFEFNVAAACLIGDLRYPVSKDGSVLDMTYFGPLIAWHLTRCGWRIDRSKRKIKPRKITARGVTEGAVEWVDVLSPRRSAGQPRQDDDGRHQQATARVACRGSAPDGWTRIADLPTNEGWHVTTNIKIEDAPDPDDGYQWTGAIRRTEMTSPGDAAYLGSLVGGMDFWGVMGDGQCPPMINGSFDLSGSDGGIDLSIIEGNQGPPGQPADIVQMQYENNFTSPADLPENLLDIALDIGKTWWIGNVVYVWTGTDFYQKQMGVPGPPGPCPVVVAQAEIIPSGIPGVSLTQPIEVQQFTTNEGLNVSLVFEFDQDTHRPAGTDRPDSQCTGLRQQHSPSDGEAIVWVAAEQMFAPSSFDFLAVPTYSVPESAFRFLPGPRCISDHLPIRASATAFRVDTAGLRQRRHLPG